ncbi:HAD-IA family hydrolase [Streptococcus sp. zg-86]|uniref:HAD-IA family hydrolase n=1 Tax=Streptococcus zhangguiae TaxID=2664091 RepID=A0A6I4RFV7_9STRE|nr:MULTISPECIES: HAD family phosphatase [unclassified Streptococcus]MTB63746.1 HAD-IA family hydrolase [Streptococcus sp. zg-86]MTB90056.1 HAD-IA family hydrolase [Streptococcus sp. zg-36]MWV55727.1 HAD-IA family hydrolase [Streptococcus sp. zg-70]QTH47983.1 HAD family phosphatase [Streptococcus sp. zg-86]
MIEAIIFDMDGVIVDTEYLDFQLQKDFVRSISKEMSVEKEQKFSKLIGRSYAYLAQAIKDLSGSSLSLAEISEQLEEYAKERYQDIDYLSLFRTDMIDILDYAKEKGLKLAVASSSRKEHIEEVLESCGILSYFDTVVSGEAFTESKPNPAIYLATLTKLGVDAQCAIAIEDSAYGIAAAKAAGVRVIAYQETRMPIDQRQADFLCQDMAAIFELIQSLV